MGSAPDSPVFGLLRDGKDPGRYFLAGVGKEKGWTEDVPLEGARAEVQSVEPIAVMMGDLQKDGAPELFLLLEIKSRFREVDGEQVRKALYVYQLAATASLVFYQTLSLDGGCDGKCGAESIEYDAEPVFPSDEEGVCSAIDVPFESLATRCKCGEAGAGCEKARDQGTRHLVWDSELGTFKDPAKDTVLMRVPDVSL